jgi:SulP family sulfate permease
MSTSGSLAAGLRSRFAGSLSGVARLRGYQRQWLRWDLIAGVTLAAYLLPAAIGDASLAGLPPEAGLYAVVFSGLVFWLFTSGDRTAITVTSAISLLLGSSLGPLAGGDSSRFGALAACVALMVAAIAFLAWLTRAGEVVKFISETVLIGFKCGVALYLGSTQLPKLFGFHGSHGDFWERSAHFLHHIEETNLVALALGVAALAVLILGKVFLRNKPVALVVVVGSIAAAGLADLQSYGVAMLGEVPQGLPTPGLPDVGWSDVKALLPLAIACFLLGAVETVAIGRTFASKQSHRINGNQELLALAAANLAAGLGRGFPVSGGMSQSLVNESAGARTPLSGLIASLLVLVVTVFLSGSLKNLPQPVLAAIILFAVTGLFKFSALQRLWRHERPEFFVPMAAMFGVLGSGLLHGVLIGAIISLILLIRRASRPHVAFLGRIPGTQRFSDLARHPDNEPVPGLLLVRPESSLLYFNAEHVRDKVLEQVQVVAPELVVFDLSACPIVDQAAAEMLAELATELRSAGIGLRLVEARASVRDVLRRGGDEGPVGQVNRFASVSDTVEEFLGGSGAPRP